MIKNKFILGATSGMEGGVGITEGHTGFLHFIYDIIKMVGIQVYVYYSLYSQNAQNVS